MGTGASAASASESEQWVLGASPEDLNTVFADFDAERQSQYQEAIAKAKADGAAAGGESEDLRAAFAGLDEEQQRQLQEALARAQGTGAAPEAEAAAAAAGTAHCRLVFSRHGESEWNVSGKFTGWVDVDLSEKGFGEAKSGGELLKEAGLQFDMAYTSYLKRAIKTCNIALEHSDQLHIPVVKTWRLNERMYGGLTGLDKKETVVKHGAEQVQVWRRSFDIPPPEIDDDSEFHPKKEAKYKDLAETDIPKTESLKTVIERVMPFWESTIMADLKAGKTVFVAAHGNSIRAMLKYLEGIPEDEITGLEIPTGTPLVYELDKDMKPIPNELAVAPLKAGKYLGDAEKIKAAAEAVKNQTKVG